MMVQQNGQGNPPPTSPLDFHKSSSALGKMCNRATESKTPALKQLAKLIAFAPLLKIWVKNGRVENAKLYKSITQTVQILTTEPVFIISLVPLLDSR